VIKNARINLIESLAVIMWLVKVVVIIEGSRIGYSMFKKSVYWTLNK